MMARMSIPRAYSNALRKDLRSRAVWPPIVAVAPGDYGVFRGGVFARIGNITTDFGISYVVEPGGHQARKFQFHSETDWNLGAEAAGDAASVKGEISIGLDGRSSFFVSVSAFDVLRLQSPRNVAVALREIEAWSHLRYFVVWELFTGEDLVFFGSESGKSSIKVRGNADDLKGFRCSGKVGGSLEFGASGDVGVQLRGAPETPATFALNVFRVKAVGDPLSLSFSAPPNDDEVVDFLADDEDYDEESSLLKI